MFLGGIPMRRNHQNTSPRKLSLKTPGIARIGLADVREGSLDGLQEPRCVVATSDSEYEMVHTRAETRAIVSGDARSATVNVVAGNHVRPSWSRVERLPVADAKAVALECVNHKGNTLAGAHSRKV